MATRALLFGSVLALSAAGCERPRVADPRATVRAYVEATRRGDPEVIYRMLSKRSQKELGRDGLRRLVTDSERELAVQAEALNRTDAQIEAIAQVRYQDGEVAVLELEEGSFKIGSAALLPSAPRTPAQALEDLRRALAIRSYAALTRVLAPQTKSALESDLGAIVRGLEDPETLQIEVRGDGADVELPGGHVVKLKREGGVWRVEDLR